jgi:DNA polymerase-4
MPELSPRIRIQLQDYQLDLIGEVAEIPESALCAVFGGQGRILRARARGIDPRPVLPPERQSEFRVSHTLTTDTNDLGVLFPLLRLLTERLGSRLRKRRLTAYRLLVETTYADYTSSSRAVPLSAAALDGELTDAAHRAFILANTKRVAVRTVALTLDRVMEEAAQLELWEGQQDSGSAGQQQHTKARLYSDPSSVTVPLSRCPAALQHALDHIRTRYGIRAVRGGPLTSHLSPLTPYHATTIFPNVALPSMTRCASAS